ncbi:hypothetical protein PFISCL1PPCAC_7666, partial [Pristionchus fissidentatus]
FVMNGPIDHSLGAFTTVTVLSPCDKMEEVDTMAKLIINDLLAAKEKVEELDVAGILNEYCGYYDVNTAF